MKKLISCLLLLATLSSCKKDNPVPSPITDPTPTSYVPSEVLGQWLYGTFSMSEFWSYDGSYLGNAFELSVAFTFSADGHYEQFVASSVNNYGCRSDGFSYFKGTVNFYESDSFTVHPTEGNFRGFYNCTPQYNFNRPAASSELADQTFYYSFETDELGKKWMLIRFHPDDEYPSYFAQTTW